jgi:cysteinyl-tRNA synthetase
LSVTWEALDAAQNALQRLRKTAYEWGSPGEPSEEFLAAFTEQINNDLNMPRALATVWDLVKGTLPASTKKATLLRLDHVLGLRLAEWQPTEETIPEGILALVEQRQAARAEKRWKDADRLREQVRQAGYEIEDTPSGPNVRHS